jgi:hypothetical protein
MLGQACIEFARDRIHSANELLRLLVGGERHHEAGSASSRLGAQVTVEQTHEPLRHG